jgi:hypothetical protein
MKRSHPESDDSNDLKPEIPFQLPEAQKPAEEEEAKDNKVTGLNMTEEQIEEIMQLTDEEFQAIKGQFQKEEWRLLKNRKSARKSRRKRKSQYKNLGEEVGALK